MFFSDCPLVILDKNGVCIGVAIPSCEDSAVIEAINKGLEELEKYGTTEAKSKRGSFSKIGHGIQFGGGSKTPGPKACGTLRERKARKAVEEFFQEPHVHTFCKMASGLLFLLIQLNLNSYFVFSF